MKTDEFKTKPQMTNEQMWREAVIQDFKRLRSEIRQLENWAVGCFLFCLAGAIVSLILFAAAVSK